MINVKEIAQRLQGFFGRAASHQAKKSGVVQRRSKLAGLLFLKTLVCGFIQNPNASLEELVEMAEELKPGLTLSKQALDQRINAKAVAFLETMLSRALKSGQGLMQLPVAVLQPFTAVHLIDSTSFELPEVLAAEFAGSGGDSSQAALKVLLVLDYLTGRYQQVGTLAGTTADQKLGKQLGPLLQAGSLNLFDLGFFSFALLEDILRQQAFFLCRLLQQVHLMVQDEAGQWQPFDLDEWLKHTRVARAELLVRLGSDADTGVPCRLCIERVPAAVAAERRRRAHAAARRAGRTPSRRYLQRLDFTLLLTNVAESVWSTAVVFEIYPLRWQVELTFKIWKSILKIASIRGLRKERILCEVYAKLIGLILFAPLLGGLRADQRQCHGNELSLWKGWRYLQRHIMTLMTALGRSRLRAVVRRICDRLVDYGRVPRRRQAPSTVDRLVQAAQMGSAIEGVNPRELRPFLGHSLQAAGS